jgi:small subunit ribosomal protein S21
VEAELENENKEKELLNGMSKEKYMSFKPQSSERAKLAAMEVVVDHGVEKAIKILKRKLIKEGLFKELKARRYYSKPSEEKKRKLKESLKKIRKEESRRQKSQMMF